MDFDFPHRDSDDSIPDCASSMERCLHCRNRRFSYPESLSVDVLYQEKFQELIGISKFKKKLIEHLFFLKIT